MNQRNPDGSGVHLAHRNGENALYAQLIAEGLVADYGRAVGLGMVFVVPVYTLAKQVVYTGVENGVIPRTSGNTLGSVPGTDLANSRPTAEQIKWGLIGAIYGLFPGLDSTKK